MVHKDGVNSENFFKSFLGKNKKIKGFEQIHQPFDFLVNFKHYVEVKSCKLYVNQKKDVPTFSHGCYECWNKSQLKKLHDQDVWICFIIQHEGQFIIQGFLKSKDLPNQRKLTISKVQHLNLKSAKQFSQYVGGNI